MELIFDELSETFTISNKANRALEYGLHCIDKIFEEASKAVEEQAVKEANEIWAKAGREARAYADTRRAFSKSSRQAC